MSPHSSLVLSAIMTGVSLAADSSSTSQPVDASLAAIPAGYNLVGFDDAGAPSRQPHVLAPATQVHTFNVYEVQGDFKARSVAWDYRALRVHYGKLNPDVAYVVAITYSNETYNKRVQSLWAGGVCIHGPHPLPLGKIERLVYPVPPESIVRGSLDLEFRLESGPNAVVSIVELWAPLPRVRALNIESVTALNDEAEVLVTDEMYDPAGGVNVSVSSDGRHLTSGATAADGAVRFARKYFEVLPREAELTFAAARQELSAARKVTMRDVVFDPVRYRPLPVVTGGLDCNQISLDGIWKINTKPGDWRKQPLIDASWSNWRVPGQWVQQGFDVPLNQTIGVAREFTIPAEWAGYRIILRFDAIHAGTKYWLDGEYLGYSENLFTPVEWDITKNARPGKTQRLDLEMKVDTVSEQLSYSSGYAFHSLGGIDRAVRIFAMPATNIDTLQVSAGLRDAYKNGTLSVRLTVDHAANGGPDGHTGLSVSMSVQSGDRKLGDQTHAVPDPDAHSGASTINFDALFPNIPTWTAEKPNLCQLTVELKRGSTLLERIERQIGFRQIELHDRQMYINGQRVKLAGVCRHEIDPLTGRADTMHHGEEDVRLLKAANLNYIRTSHYPPTQEFLDAADRIGMYVECEAPFCWVADQPDMRHTNQVLTPTSAMIDYNHAHPSIIVWSIANESAFARLFEPSNTMCKTLDPTRPTTFNNPDLKQVCDIANRHYPPMPYDAGIKDDLRPLFLGEYWFPICHEQTDIRVNPGLCELFGQGHAEPDSAYAKAAGELYAKATSLIPGALPGAWTYIRNNDQLIGGAIWAAFDEPFFLPGGKKVGYYMHHGPWGLLDAWRRPKPEYYATRCIFSPVWFPSRHVAFEPGSKTIALPIENRYAFTDLHELRLTCTQHGKNAKLEANLSPGQAGHISIPVDAKTKAGEVITVTANHPTDGIVANVDIVLGAEIKPALPEPVAGSLCSQTDGDIVVLTGETFSLVFDRKAGEFVPRDPRHRAPVTMFPMPHLSRYDFGDLKADAAKYAVLPDRETRVVDSATVTTEGSASKIEVKDHYDGFAGTTTWIVDRQGTGRISVDYIYSGQDGWAREIGARLTLPTGCDTLTWNRWSEWGHGCFPADCISRTVGTAHARRDPSLPDVAENMKPGWPWSLDQTELGTADFRGTKFNIYSASLRDAYGNGINILAQADAHVRTNLANDGIGLNLVAQCYLAPIAVKRATHLKSTFTTQLSIRPGTP